MRALLVEDDENKREDVQRFLTTVFPDLEVDTAGSYHTALRKLLAEAYVLIILDMTIPSFEKRDENSAGRLRPFGGMELLDQVSRRALPARIVVLTGYDLLGEGESAVPLRKVTEDIGRKFPRLFHGAVFYSRSEDRWKGQLKEKIDQLLMPQDAS